MEDEWKEGHTGNTSNLVPSVKQNSPSKENIAKLLEMTALANMTSISRTGIGRSSTDYTARKHKGAHELATENRNINVTCLLRSLNEREIKNNEEICIEWEKGSNELAVYHQEYTYFPKIDKYVYTFDHIFGPNSTHADIFQVLVEEKVLAAFNGYNTSVIVYGNQDKLKTSNMLGDLNNLNKKTTLGIIPRVFDYCFSQASDETSKHTMLGVQMMEISRSSNIELIRDLLNPESKLTLKEGYDGLIIQNLATNTVNNLEMAITMVKAGMRNVTKKELLAPNDTSTVGRHIITTICVSQTDPQSGMINKGKICVVDLGHDELSNLCVARVLSALNECQYHIPYRDSKLTRVLQDMVGGNALTALMLTSNPCQSKSKQTIKILDTGSKALKVTNVPYKKQDLDLKDIIKAQETMQTRIDNLEALVSQLGADVPSREAESDKKFNAKEYASKYKLNSGRGIDKSVQSSLRVTDMGVGLGDVKKERMEDRDRDNVESASKSTQEGDGSGYRIGGDDIQLLNGDQLYIIFRDTNKNKRKLWLDTLMQEEIVHLLLKFASVVDDLRIRNIQKSMMSTYYQKKVIAIRFAVKRILTLMVSLGQMFERDTPNAETDEQTLENNIKRLFKELQDGINARNELLGQIANLKDTPKTTQQRIIDSKFVKIEIKKAEFKLSVKVRKGGEEGGEEGKAFELKTEKDIVHAEEEKGVEVHIKEKDTDLLKKLTNRMAKTMDAHKEEFDSQLQYKDQSTQRFEQIIEGILNEIKALYLTAIERQNKLKRLKAEEVVESQQRIENLIHQFEIDQRIGFTMGMLVDQYEDVLHVFADQFKSPSDPSSKELHKKGEHLHLEQVKEFAEGL